jgi:glycosyltransferase involved in cell wall biosynthesis
MTFPNRNRGGSGVYARSLLAALVEREDVTAWEVAGPARSNPAGTLRWLLGGAGSALRRRLPDLVHCPTFVTPWLLPTPVVVTVHDAGVWRFPQDHSLDWRLYDRVVLTRRLRSAARVIAVSEFARQEVINGYGVRPDRVIAIHNGIDARFFEVASTSRPIDETRPRILFPGAPLGHKNLAPVLRVMATAGPESALGRACLEISGARGEDFPEQAALANSLGLTQRVRWLGQVPMDAMPRLIGDASLVVYPSLYEGFGLPPLEAMAVGTPVVAADRGSLPEVLGAAALLVDPTALPELAQAMQDVLTRPELREQLVAAGRKQARLYTWAKCAERTVDVYRSVLAAGADR